MGKNKGRIAKEHKKSPRTDPEIEVAQKIFSFVVKNRTLIFLLIIASIITFLVHMSNLNNMAKIVDDDQYLINNQLVKNPSIDSLVKFFTEIQKPSTVRGYYQPLTMTSLMIDYALGGSEDNFRQFHITSLILHILNVCLVILILHQFFGNKYTSFFCGILFGIHPMTVETLNWVSDRKTTLASFFALLSVLLYIIAIKSKSPKAKKFSIACYLLAILSKPTVTLIPVAFLVFDIWPLSVMKAGNILKNITYKIPYYLITLASIPIIVISQEDTAGVKTHSFIEMFYRYCVATTYYISKMILPINLSPHQEIPDPMSISNPTIYVGIVLAILIHTALIYAYKRKIYIFLSYLAYLIILFPAMGIVSFSNAIASDKYAYLPVIGILMMLCFTFNTVYDKFIKRTLDSGGMGVNSKAPKYIAVISVVIIALIPVGVYSAVTLKYTKKWDTTLNIYDQMLKVTPNATYLYYDIGIEYTRLGNFNKSIECYETLLKRPEKIPENVDYMVNTNIAIAYFNVNNYQKSIDNFKIALSKNPYDVYALKNLSIVYEKVNKYDEAILPLYKAIICVQTMSGSYDFDMFNPGLQEMYNMLSRLYNVVGQKKYPVEFLLKPEDIAPNNPETLVNLADLMLSRNEIGYVKLAVEYQKKMNIVNKTPDSPRLTNLSYRYLYASKQYELALQFVNYVLASSPEDSQAKEYKEMITSAMNGGEK